MSSKMSSLHRWPFGRKLNSTTATESDSGQDLKIDKTGTSTINWRQENAVVPTFWRCGPTFIESKRMSIFYEVEQKLKNNMAIILSPGHYKSPYMHLDNDDSLTYC